MEKRTLLLLLCLSVVVHPKPAEEERKSRMIEKELSDESHYVEEEHNLDYDHEAFLGEDEARTFDQLTPDESKNRLAQIVTKIDANSDGFVTVDELKLWIEYTQKRYIHEDVQRQWNSHNPQNKPTLSWEEYKEVVYGFMDNMESQDVKEEEESGISYAQMVRRDRRRWEAADSDGDGLLSQEEFANFIHPEDAKDMRSIVVLETLEDIDRDGDGRISLQEYIGDMYRGSDDDSEPSWVASERDQFSMFRDKNGDGHLDAEEVEEWIIPPEYDHAHAEAKHLVHEADADGDERLTQEEVLDKYDVFVGSQATDFGEALARHDEF